MISLLCMEEFSKKQTLADWNIWKIWKVRDIEFRNNNFLFTVFLDLVFFLIQFFLFMGIFYKRKQIISSLLCMEEFSEKQTFTDWKGSKSFQSSLWRF